MIVVPYRCISKDNPNTAVFSIIIIKKTTLKYVFMSQLHVVQLTCACQFKYVGFNSHTFLLHCISNYVGNTISFCNSQGLKNDYSSFSSLVFFHFVTNCNLDSCGLAFICNNFSHCIIKDQRPIAYLLSVIYI